jgi:hypothetical protein
LLTSIPLFAGTTIIAQGVAELSLVIGACGASYYLGACIGSLLIAAYETCDFSELAKVASWVGDFERKTGQSLYDFLKKQMAKNPQLSPIRRSLDLAFR